MGPDTMAEHIPYMLNGICIRATRWSLQSIDSNFVEESCGHPDAHYPALRGILDRQTQWMEQHMEEGCPQYMNMR